MAIGLASSCNNKIGGIALAHAAIAPASGGEAANNPALRLTRWQIRAYGQALAADPARIMELTGREIFYALSAPALERGDLNTTAWQYTAQDCVLDIYFTSSAFETKAVHYEIRSPQPVTERACLRQIAKAADTDPELRLSMAR
jgi:hypothetical protein